MRGMCGGLLVHSRSLHASKLEGCGLASKSSGEKKKEKEKEEAPLDIMPPSDSSQMLEVDLGEYSVTVFQASSNTTMCFDFKVSGTIELKEKEDYEKAFEKYKQRIREQITSTIRSADNGDLTEPSLSLIKRIIFDRINSTMKKPLVHEILIPDFSFTQN